MAAWKLAPRWRRATPACSSRPRRPRSRRSCWPRSSSRRSCRRAWSTSSPARGHRRRARRPRRGRQGRLHRLDRGRQADPAQPGRDREAPHPGAGGQGGQHRLRRRAALPGGRGHRQRHLLQPGPRLLRRVAPAGPGADRRGVVERAQATARDAAPRRPARQEHRHRRHQLAPAAGQDPRARRRRRGRGGAALVARRAHCPSAAIGSRRRVFTGVSPAQRIAREEIFGPVLSVLTFRTPDEAVEKANNTTYGLSAGVWTEKGSRILWMAARLRAGVVWANTFNRFDPSSPFGGYRESGLRPRGRPPRAGRPTSGLPGWLTAAWPSTRPTSSTSAALSLDRSRGAPTWSPAADGRPLANAALASRKDVRDAVVAARKAQPGWAGGHRLPARPGPLPGGRDARGPSRPVR